MRIAMIGHKRITAFEGGIEKTVWQLSDYMLRQGHQVTVYDRNCRQQKAQNTLALPEGIKVIKVPTLKGPAEVPLYSFLAAVHAAFGKYDVVMFHASGPCRMLPIVKLSRTKTIAFIHGIDSQRSKWGKLASRYLRSGEKTAAKKADELLVLSENNKKYFIKNYGREGTIVFNGVQAPVLPEDSDAILSKYGISKGEYILYSGRISKEKGLQYLIPGFLKCGSDNKLVIAGTVDRKHTAFVSELMDMGKNSSNIIYTGSLSQEELAVLYTNTKVFVLPSEIEGMPHSLLEALSCGAACLLSDIPENMAVAGNHAVYFKAGDSDDLREKLKMLLENSEMRKMLTAGEVEEVLDKYGLEKSVKQIQSICEQIGR